MDVIRVRAIAEINTEVLAEKIAELDPYTISDFIIRIMELADNPDLIDRSVKRLDNLSQRLLKGISHDTRRK